MARSYSRATRTVASLIFSPSNILTLSVTGIGLAVFAGQHLPRRARARSRIFGDEPGAAAPPWPPAPTNDPCRKVGVRDG